LSGINVAAGHARLGFAGDTLNTAAYLARAFAHEATRVEYLIVLGSDALSEAMIRWMHDEGIGTTRIRRHPDRIPGIYAIELDPAGERSFRYWRDRSAARTLFDDSEAARETLAGADVIYLSGITLAIISQSARESLIAACQAAKDGGRIVAFDSNFQSALWQTVESGRAAFEAMWRATTIGLPSADDERALYPAEKPEETIARLADYGVPEIVLKRGAAGPLIWRGGEIASVNISSNFIAYFGKYPHTSSEVTRGNAVIGTNCQVHVLGTTLNFVGVGFLEGKSPGQPSTKRRLGRRSRRSP